MVKTRMTGADVAAEVSCLRKLIGMRVSNVYDLNPKTYVIKLSKSSGVSETGESEKVLLLLESGVRFHTTEFERDKSTTPSSFTLKIRKHIRTRRLEDVKQLGIDRIIDFQFGMGENSFHIILELYSSGNLILTDHEYTVLTLLRSYRDDEKGFAILPRHQYPIDTCRHLLPVDRDLLMQTLQPKNLSKYISTSPDSGNSKPTDTEPDKQAREKNEAKSETTKGKPTKAKEKKEKKDKRNKSDKEETKNVNKVEKNEVFLKTVLLDVLNLPPVLCDHIILESGLELTRKMTFLDENENVFTNMSQTEFENLTSSILKIFDWFQRVLKFEFVCDGFIFMKKEKNNENDVKNDVKHDAKNEDENEKEKKNENGKEEDAKKSQMYDDFSPLFLKQYEAKGFVPYQTFDSAMDEFFSKIETQKIVQQKQSSKNQAMSKLEKIKQDQNQRVVQLKEEIDLNEKKAKLIEYNLDLVENIIFSFRKFVANSFSWADIKKIIKEEKRLSNPMAEIIHTLNLEKNEVVLLLSNNYDELDDEEKTQPVEKVEIDLSLSAYANARKFFDSKKKSFLKQEKTISAHEKAFKAAEKKTLQQLAQAKTVAEITHMRKILWFEKFNWFISSENFLILSGKDAQQNEMLVKKHMKKGDIYMHAELHGASSTIIKNKHPSNPIPPLTLMEAGSFTIARSSAWDSKIVSSAWWVFPHQVSKTPPAGEYLSLGGFMIRGKKNFLPPCPMAMAFGFLFRFDESCLGNHLNERRIRGEGEVGEGKEGRERKEWREGGEEEGEMGFGERNVREGRYGEKRKEEVGRECEEAKEEEIHQEILNENEQGKIKDDEEDEGDLNAIQEDEEEEEEGEDGEGEEKGEYDEQFEKKKNEEMEKEEKEDTDKEKEREKEKEDDLNDLLDSVFSLKYSSNVNKQTFMENKYGLSTKISNWGENGEEGERRKKEGMNEDEMHEKKVKTEKRHLSKAERKRMKKGEMKEDGKEEDDGGNDDNDNGGDGGDVTNVNREEEEEYKEKDEREKENVEEEEVDEEGEEEEGKEKEGREKNREKEKGHGIKRECKGEDKNRKKSENEKSKSMKKEEEEESRMNAVRGKKGKLKKIQKKYLDQDEEEKRLRMTVLASAGKSVLDKKLKKENENFPQKTSKNETSKKSSMVCYKCKKEGHLANDCKNFTPKNISMDSETKNAVQLNVQQNFQQNVQQSVRSNSPADVSVKSSENILVKPENENSEILQVSGEISEKSLNAQDEIAAELNFLDNSKTYLEEAKSQTGLSRRARAKLESQEIKALMEEEDEIGDVSESDLHNLSELDFLSGIPKHNDVLLYAIPVCGPYNALQNYKYRVKLTPGNGKKGKSAKTAVELFSRMSEVSAREKELMKSVSEPELVSAIIGNVKLTAPGLTKVKQSQKKGKKQAPVPVDV